MVVRSSAVVVALLSATVAISAQSYVQPPKDFSAYAGRWRTTEFRQAAGPRPLFVNQLEITVTPTEFQLDRGNAWVEHYRFDGSATDLGNGRTGWLVLVADGIAVTTKNKRPSATIFTDFYRVENDQLILDSVLSQARPDGTLAQPNPKNTRKVITYQRAR